MSKLEVVTAVILYEVTSGVGKDVTLDDWADAAFSLAPGDSSRLARSICGDPHRVAQAGDPLFDETLTFLAGSGVPDALPLGPKEDKKAIVLWGYYLGRDLLWGMVWFPVNTEREVVGQWFVSSRSASKQ